MVGIGENHCRRRGGERGGMLVSAAISPKEMEVLREAMNRGYRIILLRENGFPRLYKPSGESFYAMARTARYSHPSPPWHLFVLFHTSKAHSAIIAPAARVQLLHGEGGFIFVARHKSGQSYPFLNERAVNKK